MATNRLTLAEVINGIAGGTLDEYILSETLEKLKLKSYTHLYNIQKDMIDLTNAKTYWNKLQTVPDENVFTNDINNRYKLFQVKKSFVRNNKRLIFRRSSYFNTPLDNNTINSHREIFDYSYLVFINGALDRSAKIVCHEDISFLCINKNFMAKNLADSITDGSPVQVVFLNNSYYKDITLSMDTLIKANYTLDMSNVTKPSRYKYLAFIGLPNEIPKCYQVNDLVENKLILNTEWFNTYNAIQDVFITIVGMEYTNEIFNISDSTLPNVQYTLKNMPIPKYNNLIFEMGVNGNLTLSENGELNEKYPNVYELPDRTKTLKIINFYYENPANEEMLWDIEIPLYNRLINILDKYNNKKIRPEIDTFDPVNYNYGLNDFYATNFDDETEGDLVYKANKLNLTFKLWALILETYKTIANQNNISYHMDMSDFDLPIKERYNNYNEIESTEQRTEFNEPHYVFVYRSEENKILPYKFFVDGVYHFNDKCYVEKGYMYVYIPKVKIKADSVIEVERFRNDSFSFDLPIGNTETSLTFPSDDIKVPMNSIIFCTQDGTYIDMNNFQIKAVIKGIDTIIPSNSLMMVSNDTKLRLFPIDATYMNSTIKVICNDIPFTFIKKVTISNYTERNLNQEGLLHNIKADPSKIRIFKRGLFMPQEKYDIKFSNKINDNIYISLLFDRFINTFYIDYISDPYTCVYQAEEIDEHGIVNLEGFINKPFSLKYYDVFLNGYKLHYKQIEKLSNFAINIKNVKTRRKLYIYERGFSNDFFHFEDQEVSNMLADVLFRNDPEYQKALQDYTKIIEVDESIQDVDSMFDIIENLLIDLIVDYLGFNYVDCNVVIPQAIYNKYYPFFRSDIFFINANKTYPGDETSTEDLIFFLKPRDEHEIRNIENPYFTRENIKAMMNNVVGKFINSNAALSAEIKALYPDLVNISSVVSIDGDVNITRESLTNNATLLQP